MSMSSVTMTNTTAPKIRSPRGRNAQAKHAAPKHADPADYAHATGLEALWGYLYVTNQTQRLDELITLAIARTEEIWHRQNSK